MITRDSSEEQEHKSLPCPPSLSRPPSLSPSLPCSLSLLHLSRCPSLPHLPSSSPACGHTRAKGEGGKFLLPLPRSSLSSLLVSSRRKLLPSREESGHTRSPSLFLSPALTRPSSLSRPPALPPLPLPTSLTLSLSLPLSRPPSLSPSLSRSLSLPLSLPPCLSPALPPALPPSVSPSPLPRPPSPLPLPLPASLSLSIALPLFLSRLSLSISLSLDLFSYDVAATWISLGLLGCQLDREESTIAAVLDLEKKTESWC